MSQIDEIFLNSTTEEKIWRSVPDKNYTGKFERIWNLNAYSHA